MAKGIKPIGPPRPVQNPPPPKTKPGDGYLGPPSPGTPPKGARGYGGRTLPMRKPGKSGPMRFSFVRAARSAATAAQGVVERIGNAIVGGDFSGNRRGQYAVDIQIVRNDPAEVASGDSAIALGTGCAAAGVQSLALGVMNQAAGDYAAAVGVLANARGQGALALGYGSSAPGLEASALGARAVANIATTVNLGGPVIVRNDAQGSSPGEWFQNYAGARVVLFSGVLDLKTVADYTITLPTGCTFWPQEAGIACNDVSGLATQPTVRFGVSGSLTKHMAPRRTTNLTAAGARDRYLVLTPQSGESSLTFGVTVGAAATACSGRAYWVGLLVENE